FATGARFPGAATVTVTVSAALVTCPSLTRNENVTVAGPTGAVNDGRAADADDSDTAAPAVCDHAYVSESPSGSLLADPSSCTLALDATDWSGPASATGARFAWLDAVHASISASPTLTVEPLSAVAVKRSVVVARAVNDTLRAVPVFGSVPTLTVEPSLNVSVPAVTWSLAFGRSSRTAWSSVCGAVHVSC